MWFNQDLIDALRERQADNVTPDGNQLFGTWNGEDYPTCAGEAKVLKSLGIAGFAQESDLILVFITCDFVAGFQTAADLVGKLPAPNHTLQYGGKTYRVQDIITAPGLAFFVTGLIDPTKGV